MSLDVTLYDDSAVGLRMPARIYVRENGRTVEITRGEWDETHPGAEPVTVKETINALGEVFTANITHNLSRMAEECGLCNPLWNPEDIGATHGRDLIEPLTDGLAKLMGDKERLLGFNPPNGWGDYDLLVQFTVNYLIACRQWPDARVAVSR